LTTFVPAIVTSASRQSVVDGCKPPVLITAVPASHQGLLEKSVMTSSRPVDDVNFTRLIRAGSIGFPFWSTKLTEAWYAVRSPRVNALLPVASPWTLILLDSSKGVLP
jgi:hypothetical protein